MSQSSIPAPRAGWWPRVLGGYVAGLQRSLVSGEQLIYPAGTRDVIADGRHDFDFLHGRWQVHNVRLRERLVGCTDWDEFQARVDCGPVLDGGGNQEQFVTDWAGGYRGMTLRLYDPHQRQWSLYWANREDGVLEPPVVGRFEHGVGRFFGRDRVHGREVQVRFRWHDIQPDSAHWEQAFSTDRGDTWETNWHMHFSRVAA
ncbi:hypothetical protein [Pseudoxanthomonas indica]|uniref:DUF1579 domain-containing protein n=1 Tax=Pseudoxanthomonas indica TaxID=428993 RepID=A0A1T5KMV9_9GAMM|nr:hypothetical protein [Pseudoxanthomonas indica]GGD50339.1 hypothetical protein GCM10007235_23030 [Pseudoxanthomonas indica]SKC65112.1 hypothetical protein SAMN06296058_1849 [Pseudoxanthomonas indica]